MKKKLERESRFFRFWCGWGNHCFLQTKKGILVAWGENSFGQLSIQCDSLGDVYSPVKVRLFRHRTKMQVKKVSCGKDHTLFVTEGCGAYSAGSNSSGCLSDSTSTQRSIAVRIILDEKNVKIVDVSAAWFCSYFLSVDGAVFSAGFNNFGQLGHGNDVTLEVGKKISALSHLCISLIAVGEEWVIFRSSCGRLFGCGCNYGQFGLGNSTDLSTPTEITYFSNKGIEIDHIVASYMTAYFITPEPENRVFCSGEADEGQFGMPGRWEKSTEPLESKLLSGFQSFSTGNSWNFIVFKKNDKLYGTGRNSLFYGWATMEGDSTNNFSPVEIYLPFSAKDVKHIATRNWGTFAIQADGTIWATGLGGSGEFMDETKEDWDHFGKVGKFDMFENWMLVDVDKRERLAFMEAKCTLFCFLAMLL